MSLLRVQPGLIDALSHEMTPKFLASRAASGVPNVVPCTSIMPAKDGAGPGSQPDEDHLIFGNFLLHKTVGNLNADSRVGILVITTDLEGWILQGDFLGWEQSGPYVDRLNSTDLLRYNAYTGIRNAGVVQVKAVLHHFRISKLQVAADYVLARAACIGARESGSLEGATKMPSVVQEKLSPMTAVRVLGFLDTEGYPLVVPLLSLQPAGDSVLVCAQGMSADLLGSLPPGTPVAANLLTLDIVSFQVKGLWLESRRLLGAPIGAMSVTAVYAGGPPIPGRQVA
jgi:hypothetical protein